MKEMVVISFLQLVLPCSTYAIEEESGDDNSRPFWAAFESVIWKQSIVKKIKQFKIHKPANNVYCGNSKITNIIMAIHVLIN